VSTFVVGERKKRIANDKREEQEEHEQRGSWIRDWRRAEIPSLTLCARRDLRSIDIAGVKHNQTAFQKRTGLLICSEDLSAGAEKPTLDGSPNFHHGSRGMN
jgi:hypothetical protein